MSLRSGGPEAIAVTLQDIFTFLAPSLWFQVQMVACNPSKSLTPRQIALLCVIKASLAGREPAAPIESRNTTDADGVSVTSQFRDPMYRCLYRDGIGRYFRLVLGQVLLHKTKSFWPQFLLETEQGRIKKFIPYINRSLKSDGVNKMATFMQLDAKIAV
jgi:hypothetical protein